MSLHATRAIPSESWVTTSSPEIRRKPGSARLAATSSSGARNVPGGNWSITRSSAIRRTTSDRPGGRAGRASRRRFASAIRRRRGSSSASGSGVGGATGITGAAVTRGSGASSSRESRASLKAPLPSSAGAACTRGGTAMRARGLAAGRAALRSRGRRAGARSTSRSGTRSNITPMSSGRGGGNIQGSARPARAGSSSALSGSRDMLSRTWIPLRTAVPTSQRTMDGRRTQSQTSRPYVTGGMPAMAHFGNGTSN